MCDMTLLLCKAALCVVLSVTAFVGVSWSHCPKGIIRTLVERKRSRDDAKEGSRETHG